MTYRKLQTNFERELIFHLILNIKKGRASLSYAKEIAKEFLKILKSEDNIEGFMEALSEKAKFYPEMQEALIAVLEEFDSEMVDENLKSVRNILKGGLN